MYQITFIVFIFIILIQLIKTSKILDTKTLMEKQGRDVILSCRFEQYNSKDRIMWLKDGLVLSVNKDISGDRKKYEIFNEYDLIIKTAIDQDSGQYICQNFDQSLSKNILLIILTQPTKPDIQQINESLIENSNGKFLCITHGGNPPPKFSWFINQMKINESFYRNFSTNNHRSYSELYLPLEKYFHNKTLICQIENQALDKPLITLHNLNIQYKPEVNLYYNQTMISNHNLLVMENDYLTIDCRIDSNPILIKPITWLKNSVAISGVTSNSLILRNIKRIDDGQYTCLSTNSIGHGQSSVYIRVQYSPIVEINGGGIINENERLILVCHVDSYPSIDYYQWYKNNEKLNVSSLTSTIIIDKISKDDEGIYICMVKNTFKYLNGSLIEKFNKTQTKVIVQYAPKVSTIASIIAEDLLTNNIRFSCEIDSNPDSIIHWRFNNNNILFNTTKYSIIKTKTYSYLILQQIQSIYDYGFYSCNASNNLGYNFTTIQLRSKGVPESPKDINITYVSYSTISIKWKAGFDGGWNQSFWIILDNLLINETNQTYFTFKNLQHLKYYNITIRAFNQLGQSPLSTFIRIQTKNIPIEKFDLPLIEYALLSEIDNNLYYRLNNLTFQTIKIPLCLKIELFNQTNTCQHIVTSNGILNIDEKYFQNIRNLSICIDQYEDFCSESIRIQIKHHTSFNWIFIIVSSILTVIFLIIFGFCLFCIILRCRKRRNLTHIQENLVSTTINKKSSQQQQPIIISRVANSTNFLTNVTYPEQPTPPSSSSTKLTEIEKFSSQKCDHIILSNQNSSFTDQQSDNNNNNSKDLLSVENDLNISHCQYMGYSYPIKEDHIENNYSIPLNKKTVYEVVV